MEDPFCSCSDHDLTGISIIETLRFDPSEGLVRRDMHLARMARSAAAFDFPFAREVALEQLGAAAGPIPLRVRLTLDHSGHFAMATAPLAPTPARWTFRLAAQRLEAANPWLRHKTTRRALYDQTRAALPTGVDEVIFSNTDGALCEGTITTIFVQRRDRLLTPALSAGLLPGVLRQSLLEEGR
ncbi:MAG: aminotransferase class IV, partial [Paracoccaceae bacterium]|nr:aminotransferase class IV [Paracoccaceae bacterium]